MAGGNYGSRLKRQGKDRNAGVGALAVGGSGSDGEGDSRQIWAAKASRNILSAVLTVWIAVA